ncbi:MAG: hypothetical protein MJE77_18255 [Proteobacteria bacterium]|nr:hypothetical protein [Pseudomonadota bacterium]
MHTKGNSAQKKPLRRSAALRVVLLFVGLCVLLGATSERCGYRLWELALPSQERMMEWTETIVSQGIRRPGFAADRWSEQWLAKQFASFGLEGVRMDPIEVERWEEQTCNLEVRAASGSLVLDCFPVPFSTPVQELSGELALDSFDQTGDLTNLPGKIAVYSNVHIAVVQSVVRDELATRTYDPDNDFDTLVHTVPFGSRFQSVMLPALAAGAVGFIGIVQQGWESNKYFVPYDGEHWALPGVWVSPSVGQLLLELMDAGPVHVTVSYSADRTTTVSHNVIGSLPGVSSDWVIIGTHHDAPWLGAVEDASGMALVLAQARYWSRLPRFLRPFNMLFLVNGGHMSGGAGILDFVVTHRDTIDESIVAIHLEHVARDATVENGVLTPTDKVVPRWWFTSEIEPLEDALDSVIQAEDLRRSFILPPSIFFENPPTDGAFLLGTGVPIVQLLAAPVYLFDPSDTLEMVHEESFLPITRAVIELINELSVWDKDSLRDLRREPTPPVP